MWEITSLGSTPYGDRFDQNCMLNYLWANNRMNKPMWCNDEMYALMQDCWNWEPKDRPLFDQIIERLHAMYNREGQNSVSYFGCELITFMNHLTFFSLTPTDFSPAEAYRPLQPADAG